MKKTARILILLTAMTLVGGPGSYAADDWQALIYATAGRAATKVIIGQAPGATDASDGRHDVPAMLGGDLRMYMMVEGEPHWADLKALCSGCTTSWQVQVETEGAVSVRLSWDSAALPPGKALTLRDLTAGGPALDMKATGSYVYDSTGNREFTIEAR